MKSIKKSHIFIMLIVAFSIVISACGTKEYQAEDIDEDTDTCEVCNMVVPDNEHATQIVLENEKVLKFDDLGCLYEWKSENGAEDIGAEFVRDYHTEEWIEIKDATFVYDEEFMTPMAYGVYSFADKEDAEALVDEEGKGELMEPSDLDNHHWKANKEMMDHGDNHDGHGEDAHDHDDEQEDDEE